MKGMEFDTSQKGLRSILRDYQEIALMVLWENPEGLGSRKVWQKVSEKIKPESISRASIINFLEYMRDTGVLGGEERTGQGGTRWIYRPNMDESGFKLYVIKKILANLKRDFPKETEEALR